MERRIRVSALHEIAYYESGNPQGKPALCLHGGPGAGSDPDDLRLFDAHAFRVVQIDQRGAGRSTPSGEVVENMTWDLVADIERVREALGIERWLVTGGSWGSTLALAYAQTHPERVTGLVLRGVFLMRPEELAFFYQRGTRMLFPDAWEELAARVPLEERTDLVRAYHARVLAGDAAAASAWARYEGLTCTFLPSPAFVAMLEDPSFAMSFSRIELHYLANHAWLADRPLLAQIDRIRHLPAIVVQGRYDVVCPLKSAWDLHRAWPEAELRIIEGAGHAAHEPKIARALAEATARFR